MKNSGLLPLRDSDNRLRQKGFSLLELIIVIVVIGILTAIAVPIFGGVQEDARQSAVQAAASNGSVTVQAALSTGRNPSAALSNADNSDDIQLDLLSGVAGNPDSICVSAQWVNNPDNVSAAGPGCDGWYVDEGGGITPPPVRGDGGDSSEDTADSSMVTTWRVESSRSDGLTVNLPITGNVSAAIDWGDGSDPVDWTGNYPSYTYDSPGFYEITIEGSFNHWGLDGIKETQERRDLIDNSSSTQLVTAQEGLMSVDYWDDSIGLDSASFAFASNLTYVTELPSTITNMSHMFWEASSFNQPIGHWDVSSVNYMNETFREAHSFNQNIGGWNVENVVEMRSMFNSAPLFNKNINNWDVSSVTDMRYMFEGPESSFNQPIGDWDVRSVSSMSGMFGFNKSFDQPLGKWNTGNVGSMSNMFRESNFNQDIGGWDTSNVSTMYRMFKMTGAFNQDISEWDFSSITSVVSMFEEARAFNQDISDWNIPSDVSRTSFRKNSALEAINSPFG